MFENETTLLHAGGKVYDPVKARAYYLRTRKLKGRDPGEQDTPGSNTKGEGGTKTSTKIVVKGPVQTSKQRQDAVNARVDALRARLSTLHDILSDYLKQAGSKSGSKSTTDSKTSSNSSSNKKSDLTTQEKHKAATRSKDYYDKHKTTSSRDDSNVSSEIKAVREKIKKIRAELKDALEKAREQSIKPKTVKGR